MIGKFNRFHFRPAQNSDPKRPFRSSALKRNSNDTSALWAEKRKPGSGGACRVFSALPWRNARSVLTIWGRRALASSGALGRLVKICRFAKRPLQFDIFGTRFSVLVPFASGRTLFIAGNGGVNNRLSNTT